jgi:hypothetical protein
MSGAPARVLIVGMPRSGTTLFATFLAAQRGCSFITDYVPVFEALSERLGVRLNEPLPAAERRVALAMTRDQFLHLGHPVLLGVDAFRTLDDLHREVMRELAKADDQIVGHKLVLTAERARAVLEETDCVVVVLYRDPRDAAESFYYRFGRGVEGYLLDWKRMIALIQDLRDHPRLVAIRYEELVRDPRAALKGFRARTGLDVDWDLSASMFRSRLSTEGVAFQPNSSFGDVAERFDAHPVERWRKSLDSRVVRYAAWTCRDAIASLGYPRTPAGIPTFRERLEFARRALVVRAERAATARSEQLNRLLDRVAPPLRPTRR